MEKIHREFYRNFVIELKQIKKCPYSGMIWSYNVKGTDIDGESENYRDCLMYAHDKIDIYLYNKDLIDTNKTYILN
jgi:uncharacterized UPF0160 family protein